MALDKRTGEEIWRALSSDTEPGYNQPIIFEVGGVRQLIIFHPAGFSSLDPSTGKVYWEIEHRSQMGIVVATPVRSGPYLFFTSQYGGARMLRLDAVKPAASLLWSGPGEQDRGMTRDTPNTLNSVISTPVISDGYVYGIDNDGQLRCLDAAPVAADEVIFDILVAPLDQQSGRINFQRVNAREGLRRGIVPSH